jgi:hypothetical protein
MRIRWLPWKFLIQRAARSYGVIDPISLLARLRRFAQPSEIQEPVELLRAGIIFHARGLINTRAIQHNLDWIWPYWVEKQFDPNDVAFMPRGFAISHVNLTHRNWTAVGQTNLPLYPIVDPRGLVTPLYDGWSLDFWIVTANGRKLLPSRLECIDQCLKFDPQPTVRTTSRLDGMHLTVDVTVENRRNIPQLIARVKGRSTTGGQLVVALRPYNPEGIQFIETVAYESESSCWRVNNETTVRFSDQPAQVLFSDYATGDVIHKIGAGKTGQRGNCDVGMATAAALFDLTQDSQRRLEVSVPLTEELQRRNIQWSPLENSWQSALAGSARLQVPDSRLQFLYDASLRTLVLLSAGDVVPGPYTYRRFWFRDACLMLNAMLAVGLERRCRRLLDTFFPRQNKLGYFKSQEGEWDSNGQVLWTVDRFQQLTGEGLSPSWVKAVIRGAEWIKKKRKSSDPGTAHAGLLPAGFSAEHLGPNDYYYWDDFWSLAGLNAAARLAGRFDSADTRDRLQREAASFRDAIFSSIAGIPEKQKRGAIPASPYRRMDAGAVGSLVADYPLQLTAPGDSQILNTIEFLLANSFHAGGFFQNMIHSGINPYLTLCIAQTLLRNHDLRYRGLIEAVADLASATGQWPEAIHPHTGGGCMGDGQHGWAAAEWVMMVRNIFVREEDRQLIVGAGIFPEWLESQTDVCFGPTPTPFGAVEVHIFRQGIDHLLSFDARWRDKPPPVIIRIPGFQSETVRDFEQPVKLLPETRAS